MRIVLGLAPFQSEVTVTAERGAMADVDRTAPIVTVRAASDFRQRPLATIGNALEGATGVMVQQSTYGQASPFLRGLTGYQVLNLVDGVRVNNTTFRSGPNQYLAFVDPSQGGRIEAMLGPASAQFGSDAMGGAIQVLTPHVRFQHEQPAAMTTGGAQPVRGERRRGARRRMRPLFLRGQKRHGLARRLAPRSSAICAPGTARDSHHVLRRLFGLDDDQIDDLLGDRQVDTGFTQSGLHAKAAARLGTDQNLDRLVPAKRSGRRARLQGSVGRARAAAVGFRSAASCSSSTRATSGSMSGASTG